MKYRWTRPHPGITMHKIPVDWNVGGLLFTVGVTLVFLIGIPIAKWFLLFALIAGGGVAWFLHWLHERS